MVPSILRSRWLRRVTGAFSLALLASLVSVSLVFANVPLTQISSDPYTNTSSYHATQVEPDTYSSGNTIVSAFQSGRFQNGGASNVGWATSTNSGSSWTHGFLPGTTVFATPAGPYARVSDPAVAFDARHNVWLVSTLALNSSVNGVAVIVNRSTNGGTTWTNPVVVARAGSGQNLDKDWIVCDDTSTSPNYGHCYAEWDDNGHGNQLHMARSTDGGQTWTSSTVPSTFVIGGQPLVQPSGTVVVPIDNAFEGAIESFVSTNGGSSYSGPFSISNISSHTEAGNLRSGPLPTAEIDGSGKVYVVWSDCRFESGCSANDLVMSTSTNGTSWSAVTRIPIDAVGSGVDHFIPGLAVDKATSGSSAHLGLAYYYYPHTSCSTSTCKLDVGFISSTNGGSTWSTTTMVAGPMTLTWLPLTTQGYMVGDYISTSYSGGKAYPVIAVAFSTGKACTLGNITSCNEAMYTPTGGLAIVGGSGTSHDVPVFTASGASSRLYTAR